MSYTFAGVAIDSSNTNTSTASFNIGGSVSPFVVVAVEQQNGHAAPTMSIGGVSLNLDFIDPLTNEAFFSGISTGLSGTQTVSLTAGGSAFETRSYSLWYFPSIMYLSHTGSTSSTTITIPVNAGESLFAIGHALGGTFNYSGSTVAPTGDRPITGGSNNPESADWAISLSNPSFNVVAGRSGNHAAVTYSATPPSPLTFANAGSVIRM